MAKFCQSGKKGAEENFLKKFLIYNNDKLPKTKTNFNFFQKLVELFLCIGWKTISGPGNTDQVAAERTANITNNVGSYMHIDRAYTKQTEKEREREREP